MGRMVISFVNRTLEGKSLVEGTTYALLVLVPKIDKPSRINQFRLISLCNVNYKIATKIIANRFKEVLKEISSPNQASFIQGRQGTEYVIIYQEVLHFLKKRKETKGGMIIKLNLEKAYDRVDWAFILDSL